MEFGTISRSGITEDNSWRFPEIPTGVGTLPSHLHTTILHTSTPVVQSHLSSPNISSNSLCTSKLNLEWFKVWAAKSDKLKSFCKLFAKRLLEILTHSTVAARQKVLFLPISWSQVRNTVEALYSMILYTTIFCITRWTHGTPNLQRPTRTLIVLLGFWIKQILCNWFVYCLCCWLWMNPHVACYQCQQWRQDQLPQTFTAYGPFCWSQ